MTNILKDILDAMKPNSFITVTLTDDSYSIESIFPSLPSNEKSICLPMTWNDKTQSYTSYTMKDVNDLLNKEKPND